MAPVAPAPANAEGNTTPNPKKSRKPSNKNKGGGDSRQQQQQSEQPADGEAPSSPAGGSLPVVSLHDDDAALYKKIAQKANIALHQHQITMTCYIPTQSVGAVIGRRGSTIAQIQKYAQQVTSTISSGNTNAPVRVSIVGHDTTTSSTTAPATPSTGANNNNPEEDTSNNNISSNAGTAGGNGSTNTTTTTANPSSSTTTSSSSSSVPYTYSPLDWSSPHWTPVVIRADPVAALAAAHRIQELVGGSDHLDDVVMDLPLHRNRHAALVGKRGSTLMALSADTQVRIMVPRRELRHDVIQLEGPLARVKLCLERVATIVADASSNSNTTTAGSGKSNKESTPSKTPKSPRNKDSGRDKDGNSGNDKSSSGGGGSEDGGGPTSTSSSSGAVVSQTLLVSQLPSQTKLRTVSRKTETSIKKKKVGDDQWQLTATGSNEQSVQTALSLLQKWIDDNSNNAGGGGSGTGESSGNSGGGGGNGAPRNNRGRGGRGGGGRGGNNKSPKKGNRTTSSGSNNNNAPANKSNE